MDTPGPMIYLQLFSVGLTENNSHWLNLSIYIFRLGSSRASSDGVTGPSKPS